MFARLLLALASTTACEAWGKTPPQTATEAYAQVSVFREQHGDVIWGDRPASPGQLRSIVADLESSLAAIRTPLIHDLAEGNRYLRFRRYNLLADLIKLHARLGDADAAFAAMHQFAGMSWSEQILAMVETDPFVQKLKGDARYARVLATQRIMQRFGENSVLVDATDPDESMRIAGLARLWSVARDGFVWFDLVPELDWDKQFAAHIPEVSTAADTEAYYRVLMRFVAQLRDGHSNVYPPERLASRFYARPDLRTRRIEGRVIVTELLGETGSPPAIALGDRLLTIDGMPVDAYADAKVAPYVSSSTPQDRELRTFGYSLLAGPVGEPIALGLERADGTRYVTRVERSWGKQTPARQTESFALRADGLAVLTARQFESGAAARLLEANVEKLFSAKALIIDIRGNGGGNSRHGLDILAWLSKEPAPAMVSTYREGTAFASAHAGGATAFDWRTIEAAAPTAPRPKVFDGPVALLVDAGTFSAAEDTAAAFKLMQRGVIVGEHTGGSTGQPLQFGLPGGGQFRICVKRDSFPDGTHFVGVGVSPDEVVRRTVADVRSARDPVLERAAIALRERAGRPKSGPAQQAARFPEDAADLDAL